MSDMTVTVSGHLAQAQAAVGQVFGPDPAIGPVRALPAPLLKLMMDWPTRTDDWIDVALHLPLTWDISTEMSKGGVKAVQLRLNRVTILHQAFPGARANVIGYALRTDDAGLEAIDLYVKVCQAEMRRLRQAH